VKIGARIAVVIPTVTGREDMLARVVAAYDATTPNMTLAVMRGFSTCAEAWNAGAEQLAGSLIGTTYLHFGADDLVPDDRWWVSAVDAVDQGVMPAPRIVNAAGELDYCGEHGRDLPEWTAVQMSVVPFFRWDQWDEIGPCLPIHYFSDNYLSYRAALAGYPTAVRRGYSFTHLWAQPGRGAGMSYEQRMRHDGEVFAAATGMRVP
jgi:hypothetical protein